LLFGGRCEEKQEEDVRVHQLGIFGKAQETGFDIWIFPRFSPDEQVSKFGFFRSFLFKGRAQPKKSQSSDLSAVSWDLKDGLAQIFLKLRLLRSFLGILKGRTHPKK
jgi:hypothetical protein